MKVAMKTRLKPHHFGKNSADHFGDALHDLQIDYYPSVFHSAAEF